MYQTADSIIFNEYFFQFTLLLITFIVAFVFSRMMNLSVKSLFALHTTILFFFIFMELIDYFMIIFAILELIFIIKNLGGNEVESD